MWILQSSKGENDFSENEKFPKPLGVMKGIWISMMGWMCSGGRGPGGGCFLTTRWSGRLVLLGYTFFMYISVATYTANLATFMVCLPATVSVCLSVCLSVSVARARALSSLSLSLSLSLSSLSLSFSLSARDALRSTEFRCLAGVLCFIFIRYSRIGPWVKSKALMTWCREVLKSAST
jgi:hypothetical protein